MAFHSHADARAKAPTQRVGTAAMQEYRVARARGSFSSWCSFRGEMRETYFHSVRVRIQPFECRNVDRGRAQVFQPFRRELLHSDPLHEVSERQSAVRTSETVG